MPEFDFADQIDAWRNSRDDNWKWGTTEEPPLTEEEEAERAAQAAEYAARFASEQAARDAIVAAKAANPARVAEIEADVGAKAARLAALNEAESEAYRRRYTALEGDPQVAGYFAKTYNHLDRMDPAELASGTHGLLFPMETWEAIADYAGALQARRAADPGPTAHGFTPVSWAITCAARHDGVDC